ncbi:MAG: hypothetical protein ABIH41_07195 [Nanoarchaeota archaeon]
MGLEEIKSDLIAQAKAEASSISKHHQAQVEALKKEYAERLAQEEGTLKAATDHKLKQLRAGHEQTVTFEKRRLLLERKKQIIDEVFEESRTSLQQMEKADRKRLYAKYLSAAKRQIDVARIITGEQDKDLFKGHDVKVGPINGGFIAETKDGTVRVDMTFEARHAQMKQTLTAQIAGILFKK